MSSVPKITASELVLSAIFFLQQKNGVSAAEITKFICNKRKCKPGDVKAQVKKALSRAIKNGIFSKKRGLYKIENGFGEKLKKRAGKKKQPTKTKRKTKPKNVKKADVPTTLVAKFHEFQPENCAFDDEVFIIDNFPQKNIPPEKPGLQENKKGQLKDKEQLRSSESRTGNAAVEPVDYSEAAHNIEYIDDKFFMADKDDDFYDDDDDDDDDGEDDEVDYFSDDPIQGTYNGEYSETNVPEYSNSESETQAKNENKKRKSTESSESVYKRKRIESSNEPEDEDYEKKRKKRFNRKEKPSAKYSENDKGSESSEDFESEEEKNLERGKSEYSFEETESEYTSEQEFKKNEILSKEQINKSNTNNRGNAPNENQNQTDGKAKEPAEGYEKDMTKQVSNEMKEENTKEKQKGLDKNDGNETLKSGEPSSNPSESENQKKQSFSSTSDSIKQHPAVPQESIGHLDERACSRSSKRDTTAKLFYSGIKRTGGKDKKRSMSESRSSASRNRKNYIS